MITVVAQAVPASIQITANRIIRKDKQARLAQTRDLTTIQQRAFYNSNL